MSEDMNAGDRAMVEALANAGFDQCMMYETDSSQRCMKQDILVADLKSALLSRLAALRAERDALAARVKNLEKLSQPAPTALLVWPGLEGEGLERAEKVWIATYNEASERGLSCDDARRAAYTADAAYLWRAMVASLPGMSDLPHPSPWVSVEDWPVSRIALAALADPYDGGAK